MAPCQCRQSATVWAVQWAGLGNLFGRSSAAAFGLQISNPNDPLHQ